MPEIGATLREARMRARIDITEVEAATKIRAKYLRAIENEEWDLLPGPTFVKSFIREYADCLGLDARALIEEYKLRYERPSEHELQPIAPSLGRDRRNAGWGGGGRGVPRWAIVGVLLVALLGALFAVGSLGGDDDDGGGGGATTPPAATSDAQQQAGRRAAARRATRRAPRTAATPRLARVRLVPTGTVNVCLVDQDGKVLIPGTTFQAGDRIPEQRAKGMKVTLGNNQVELTVNGRAVPIGASANAINFELSPRGARELAAADAPTCAP